MSPNGSSSYCSDALQLWQIAYNKRIKSLTHGLRRFGSYFRQCVIALYTGVVRYS